MVRVGCYALGGGSDDLALEMEKMKWLWRLLVLAAAVWLGWVGWNRFFVSEQARILRLIRRMAAAVEQNRLVALAECIAGDYTDERGWDKAALLAMVRATRSQYETMLIYIGDAVIELSDEGQKAQATLVARVLTRRAGGGSTELNAERGRLFFRKAGGGWKLTRVDSPELRFE
ncbi:MAG: nuclear transport factor 2 family protein [Verrucomicrobiae bacterium]|nr:nuclear transport factor 2 family protein [Verrucomicrobiae bacterium]